MGRNDTRSDPAGPRSGGEALWPACADVADPDVFFPDRSEAATEALRVCVSCEVVRACATYALTTRERHGVWGGLTERDRERLWARQARRAAQPGQRGA